MKFIKSIAALTFLFTTVLVHSTYSQEQIVSAEPKPIETKTLLGLPKIHFLGLYVAPEYQLAQLAGKFTSMTGGSVMLLVNKKFAIGASGFTTLDNFVPTQISQTKDFRLNNSFGGVRLEYTLNPNNAVHVSFPLLIGGGMASIDSVNTHNNQINSEANETHGRSEQNGGVSYFIVQPGVNVEANLFRYAKIFAGVSYRILAGADEGSEVVASSIPPPTIDRLSGLSFSVG